MNVLIVGAAGMVGRKLTDHLVKEQHLAGTPIQKLVLCDIIAPELPDDCSLGISTNVADLTEPGQAESLIADRPDVIYHLAAIVSGEAELDFDRGYRINVDGTRALLEAIRSAAYVPRLIFTSSIGVFGAPLPDLIPDTYHQTPQTSYGTQKTICELLITDYSRKGFVDGIALRLPTICVRPGKPNRAASGFFSGIIREPLNGQEAILPVDEDLRHWHASPRSAVGFLVHAATLTDESTGVNRAITLPGVSVTVGEQIEALRRVAGNEVARRIVKQPDPLVQEICRSWPTRFAADRALAMGFRAEDNFDDIIRVYMEDELGIS